MIDRYRYMSMYEMICETCGEIGFHASRVGAESRAERHSEETGHVCDIRAMKSP